MNRGLPIAIGYRYRQRIQVSAAGQPVQIFPSGCVLKAEVRHAPPVDTLITTLTTGDGNLLRVDDATLDITIPADVTAQMVPGVVFLDLVRTDVDPDEYEHVMLRIDVIQPVTRPT